MRLFVHAGLHKTASTFLQHAMHDHREALAARGVWYAAAPDFAAHHRAAWELLGGGTALLDTMLAEARAAGMRAMILSSEDLETVLHAPATAGLIADRAARIGASVEWHVVLREPGAYFASLYAQLPWHVYVDVFWLFAEAMNKGGVLMPDPAPNWGGTPCWFYCFDQARWLGNFVERSGQRPLVHDYTDDRPFPGWRLLDRLGVLDLIERLPGEAGQNRRHAESTVRDGYRARIVEAGGGSIASQVDAAVSVSLAAMPECAKLVGDRFSDSHHAALARYGGW